MKYFCLVTAVTQRSFNETPSGGHLHTVRLHRPCCRNSKGNIRQCFSFFSGNPGIFVQSHLHWQVKKINQDFVLKLLSYINIFSLAICWELGVIPGRETWETETTGISCQKLIRALYGYLEQLPLSWDSPNYPTCCWKVSQFLMGKPWIQPNLLPALEGRY